MIKMTVLLTTTILLFSGAAFAAKPATSTASTDTTVVSQTETNAAISGDSREVRRDFRKLLDKYPPTVGTVLKLDPSLFNNPAYMANYPLLAAFVAQHPEIAHDTDFFLDSVPGLRYQDPNPAGFRMFNEVLGELGGFTVFLVVTWVLTWAVRTLIQQRRWSRLTRIQTEVHSKLLDRFTSNEELLAYIQSTAGKRFLESAPIQLDNGTAPMSAPLGRIFGSMQAGLVITAAGIGLWLASGHVPAEASEPLYAIATVAVCVGIALVLSAGAFYAISRRFGLWQAPLGGNAGAE